jgi:hypothetical protein
MPGSSGTASPSGVCSISTWSEASGAANAWDAIKFIIKRKRIGIAFKIIGP